MSHRFDDMRRRVLRKRDFATKHKLVKMLRRELRDKNKDIVLSSVSVGFNGDKVGIIIEATYGMSLLIQDALKGNSITKFFDIRFKVDESYPVEAVNKAQRGMVNNA